MKKQITLLFALLTMELSSGRIMAMPDSIQAPVAVAVSAASPAGVDTLFNTDPDTVTQSNDVSDNTTDESDGLGWKIGSIVAVVIATVLGKKFGWLPAAFESIKGIVQSKKRKKKNNTPDSQDETAK